jgi:hypothetical protein
MTRSLLVGLISAVASVAYAGPKSDMTKDDFVITTSLSPADVKLVVEIAKVGMKDLDRTAKDFPGVDVDHGTVKLVSADEQVRNGYIEMRLLGDDQDYPRFRNFCETKPKLVFDAAALKGMTDVGQVPGFQGAVLEGLWRACSGSETSKATVKKIKTIHFTLAAARCAKHPDYAPSYASFAYAFHAKTGEMTVGLCMYGPTNIADSVTTWIGLQ